MIVLSKAVQRLIDYSKTDRGDGTALLVGKRRSRKIDEIIGLCRRLGMSPMNESKRDFAGMRWSWTGSHLFVREMLWHEILHEIAHFQVSDIEHRRLPDFGLGGPNQKRSQKAHVREEEASLLGIYWQCSLGLPVLDTMQEHGWFEYAQSRTPEFDFQVMEEVTLRLQHMGVLDQHGTPKPVVRRC